MKCIEWRSISQVHMLFRFLLLLLGSLRCHPNYSTSFFPLLLGFFSIPFKRNLMITSRCSMAFFRELSMDHYRDAQSRCLKPVV